MEKNAQTDLLDILDICGYFPMEVLDISEPEPEFIESQWIGCGIPYPHDNTPSSIITAHSEKFNPSLDLKCIPSRTDSVSTLTTAILPKQSHTLQTHPLGSWFSHELPNTSLDVLTHATEQVPSPELLDQLWNISGDMWFQGYKSIQDPRRKTNERFPLSALGFWKTLETMLLARYSWRGSERWLTDALSSVTNEFRGICGMELVEKVTDYMKRISWDKDIQTEKGQVISTQRFTCLLGSGSDATKLGWLSDSIMDLMIELLNTWLIEKFPSTKIVIAPLVISAELIRGYRDHDYSSTRLLRRLKKDFENGYCNEIYFPMLISGCHWICFHINLQERYVEYGDSQAGSVGAPERELRAIQDWLQVSFGYRFKLKGRTIRSGVQTDMRSCGLFVLNMLEHAILNESLCDQSDMAQYRAWWFIQSVDRYAKNALADVVPKTPIRRLGLMDLLNSGSSKLRQVVTPKKKKSVQGSDSPKRSHSPLLSILSLRRSRTPEISFIPSTVTASSTSEDHTGFPDGASNIASSVASLGDHSLYSDATKSSMDINVTSMIDGDTQLLKVHSPSGTSIFSPPVATPFKSHQKLPSTGDSDHDTPIMAKRKRVSDVGIDTAKKKRGLDPPPDLEVSDSESDSGDDTEAEVVVRKLQKGRKKGKGITAKSQKEAEVRARVRDGTFEVDADSLAEWQDKCRELDPWIEFKKNDPRSFRCSRCMKWRKVRAPYDFTRFRDHWNSTACKSSGVKMTPSLLGFLIPGKGKAVEKPGPSQINTTVEKRACPGLTVDLEPRIGTYLERPSGIGGGGRTLGEVAREMFRREYQDLSKSEKKEVRNMQEKEHRWRVERDRNRVVATDCQQTVTVKGNQTPKPCDRCMNVLQLKSFKDVINKPLPSDENCKFANSKYRHEGLFNLFSKFNGLKDLVDSADAGTPLTRYAQGIASGRYYENKVLAGLIQCVVTKHERELSGTGMQNFKYPPEWDEFCHVLSIESPLAYRSLQEHLPGRSERSFRHIRSKMPAFPMSIEPATFEQVAARLDQLSYTGPVALSCDDTKLLQSLRLCWDASQQIHVLVGSIHGPVQVPDTDTMRSVLDEHTKFRATKVRLFVAQVALPGVSPILIAAIPLLESNKAEDLAEYSLTIIRGLIAHRVKVVSYACDGTEVERKVERLLVKAHPHHTYTIPCPTRDCYDLIIIVTMIDGYPIIMLQDSKHGLKSYRNNLFSGARLLIFGDYVALFRHVYEMAFSESSPLYHRDVDKVDRQDDNAACRLFSSASLDWIIQHHPEQLGLITYLFTFGELIDAYQNRSITHSERFKIALRTYYFVKMWRASLLKAEYPLSRYFISRELYDITLILIEGLCGLILIHRDYYHTDDIPFPLLPWLHSTESCEHAFGKARKFIKDFTLMDFYHMIQKIRVRIHETFTLGQSSDPRPAAHGYNHTYVDFRDVNIRNLASYPSDETISELAVEAMDEAETLLRNLGIDYDLLASSSTGVIAGTLTGDPIIDDDDETINDAEEFMSETLSPAEPDAAEDLQELVLQAANADWTGSTMKFDDKLSSLASAAAALTINDIMTVNAIPDISNGTIDEIVAVEQANIQNATTVLPPQFTSSAIPSVPPVLSLDDHLNLQALVDVRRGHETRQATDGIRLRGSSHPDPDNDDKGSRWKLVKEFYALLKEYNQLKGIGTGLERKARWYEDATSSSKPGNSYNASIVASKAAQKVVDSRFQIFTAAKMPQVALLKDARISSLRRLVIGDHGIVFDGKKMLIGKVLAMYVASSGRHSSTNSAITIGALSYINVELWELKYRDEFRRKKSRIGTRQFASLPSFSFLSLISPPKPGKLANEVVLSRFDSALFEELSNALPQAAIASGLSRKRKELLDFDNEEVVDNNTEGQKTAGQSKKGKRKLVQRGKGAAGTGKSSARKGKEKAVN